MTAAAALPLLPLPPATGARRHIPNALTLARLVLAAAFVALLSVIRVDPLPAPASALDRVALLADPATAALGAAAAIFILAALTDALDGILARKWNAISRFGRVMDPMADKVLVLGAFVMLAGPAFTALDPDTGERFQLSAVAPWMVVVILARELLVTSLRGVYEAAGVDFSAGIAGKLKMIAQSAAVPLILLIVAFSAPAPGTPARGLLSAIAWGTVLITAWSAVPYVTKALAARRTARPTAAQAVLAEALPPATLAQPDPPDRPTPPAIVAVEPVRIPTPRTRSQAAARSRSGTDGAAPTPPPTPSPTPRRAASGPNTPRKRPR